MEKTDIIIPVYKPDNTFLTLIEKLEHGFADVVEGTVYTITSRLERQKLLETEKKVSEKGPARKFFRLNEAGKQELAAFWTRWDFLSEKLAEIRRDR